MDVVARGSRVLGVRRLGDKGASPGAPVLKAALARSGNCVGNLRCVRDQNVFLVEDRRGTNPDRSAALYSDPLSRDYAARVQSSIS